MGFGRSQPSSALNGWQNSPGHNALITEQNGWGPFLALGVGINGPFAHMWMGEVADPAGSPPLCDVAEAAPTVAATVAPTVAPTTAPTAIPNAPTGEIMNQTGTIANDGTAHTFDVATNRRYSVVLTPSADFDVAAQYTCTTGNSTQSASIDSQWEGVAETFSIIAPANGTCTVSVSGYNGSSGDYTIVITAQ